MDDGFRDQSGAICDEYQRYDGRVKYIDDQFVSAKVAEDVTYMQPVEALNCLMGGKLCTRPVQTLIWIYSQWKM